MRVQKIQTFSNNGLYPPQNLSINLKTSPKQTELWNTLQPNCCDKCGGEIERKRIDSAENIVEYRPVCQKCGNDDIPQMVLGGGAAGGGKAGLLDSKVLTPTGFKLLKDIDVDDRVISPITGKAQRVIKIHPSDYFKFYELQFSDGTSFKSSEGHLWTVYVNGVKKTLETRELLNVGHNKQIIVPSTAPVHFSIPKVTNYYEGNPYLVGLIYSANLKAHRSKQSETKFNLVFGDDDIDRLTYIVSSGILDGIDYSLAKYEGGVYLRVEDEESSNYIDHKLEISKTYKYAPAHIRRDFIKGFLDGGGQVQDGGLVKYVDIKDNVADDILYMMRSLGYIAGIEGNTLYVQAQNPLDLTCVGMNQNIEPSEKFGKQIVKITYIGELLGRCITVEEPHGLYVVDDFTVTHNSFIGCNWILSSCVRFAGIRAVIARKTIKSLTESTWNTLKTIMDNWGLIEGINYKENITAGTILLWNGSIIIKKELDLLPSDPTYQRLGSSEFTIAFIDEVGEISEKGVEVLYSRLRWKVYDTFKVPKLLLSTNPVPNWVRDRFVQDRNGNPVKTRRNERYVPFSVFDNPDEQFVSVYASTLASMRDSREKDRLLHGNWDFIHAKDTVIYSQFDGDKHLVQGLFEKKYNPLIPLTFVWDFNVIPQMSVFMAQIDYNKKEIYILKEFSGTPKDKNNSTPAMAREMAGYIASLGHNGGINITGDPSGKQRSTASEVGVNNYTIIKDSLRNQGIRSTELLLPKTPPQKTRCEFVNKVLDGSLGWKIFIDLSCRTLTNDLLFQEQNPDGTKSKKKITDPETGSKYEKYGHFSDNLDYFLVLYLRDLWNMYINGGTSSNGMAPALISSRPKMRFGF